MGDIIGVSNIINGREIWRVSGRCLFQCKTWGGGTQFS